MHSKLILSEAFQGTTKEAVLTTRVSEILYWLIELDAKEQGTSIATLSRGLISFHYIAGQIKSKLEEGSELTGNDLGLIENLRAHIQDILNTLDEIDELQGKKRLEIREASKTANQRMIEEAARSIVMKLFGGEKAFEEFKSQLQKKKRSKP